MMLEMNLPITTLEELRLVTDALLELLPDAETSEDGDEIQPMDPLIDKILMQAEESDGGEFELDLDEEDTDRVRTALENLLENAAAEGDMFKTGEAQVLLNRLGH